MNLILTLQLYSFNKDEINIILNGTIICYNGMHYIVSVHKGLPIIKINIGDIPINMDTVIKCKWNDLLIIKLNTELLIKLSDAFVFKQFVKKQMDATNKYYTNDIIFKYKGNLFLPISMIPYNPLIMYNVMTTTNTIKNVLAGSSIYTSDNKLCGIVLQINKKTIYSIPINYIFMLLNRSDISNDTIFTLNEDISQIYKINNFKVICDKIYCRIHKTYIPVETYIVTNGNIKYYIEYKNEISQGFTLRRNVELSRFTNNYINIDNMIITNDNIVKITSGFLHWLKIIGETEPSINNILVKIITNIEKIDNFKIEYVDNMFNMIKIK
jgi:hypothetical protein